MTSASPQETIAALEDEALAPRTRAEYARFVRAWRKSGHEFGDWWSGWQVDRGPSALAVGRAAARHAGIWTPTLDRAHRGAVKSRQVEPAQAPPMVVGDFVGLARYILAAPSRGRRTDKALWCALVIGWWGGLRVSEAVAVTANDLTMTADREMVHLAVRRGKTHAKTIVITLPSRPTAPEVCPRRVYEAVRVFFDDRKIFGASLRTFQRRFGAAVAAAHAAGWIGRGDYTTHSMRAGMATELDAAGVSMGQIARHGRWKRVDTVLGYCRKRGDSPLTRIII